MSTHAVQKPGIIQILNIFSIPVSIGLAISYSFLSSWLYHTHDIITAVLLGIGVWLIYTLDHLLDGMKLKERGASLRHHIHYKYRVQIAWLFAIVALLFLVLSFTFLDKSVIYFGLGLAALTALHFLINFLVKPSAKIFLKEPMIAFVVTLALLGIPCAQHEADWRGSVLPFILLFFINLANLLIFSFYDHQEDEESGIKSLSVIIGQARIRIYAAATLLGAVLVLVALTIFTQHDIEVHVIFALMILCLTIILLKWRYFALKGRYRFWGDFIFILPILYFLI